MANTIQNQVATTNNSEKKTMQSYIKSMEGEIPPVLPRRDDGRRAARS